MSAAEPSETTGKAPPNLGSYRLIRPLGSGGMSSVFHAIHLESGHEVAVKVLPRTLARNPTLLQRFLREAKNAESLEHPNIAAIYDRGFDGGRHYLVLEYVAGGDLHERVREGGPLPVAEAVRVIRSAAEGLDYASGRGVTHRDVKPANLLVTPEGRVKIIDLGLALQAESEDERVTRDGTTVGTVDYMAPEQARDSRATSERSDIYSLGCTLYFLLTGAAPYPGGDVPDKLGRHCTAPIPDARTLRPEVSEPLALLVQRMMAKKPEARFADYIKLISALDALPESRGDTGSALDALIADDDDEPVDALIADDDDDDVGLAPVEGAATKPARPTLPGPGGTKPDRRAPATAPEPEPAEVSLAMLAGIEDDAPTTRGRQRVAVSAPAPEDDLFAIQGARPAPRASSKEVPLSTWVAAGAVLGLAIALVGFGVLQVLAPTGAGPVTPDRPPDEGQGGAVDEATSPAVPPPVVRAPERAVVVKKAAPPPPPSVPEWVEPGEPPIAASPEPSYPAEVEAAALPEWARRPVPPVADGPVVTVRRIPIATDASDVATLREALDRNGGVVEIADNGPFFEDDFRIAGKSRLVRARAGFRPMIVVGPSSTALVRDRGSVFSLDASRLVLEGIDLIVDAKALPQPLTSLFHLKGAELALDRCTVTVLNTTQHPFSLVRVEEPTDQRPNRNSLVRVESSLIRGPSPSVFDMPGPGELVILRSVVVGGSDAIVVHRATSPRGDRRYDFARSLLASRGSILELPGGRTAPPQVRAVGSTFAKVVGLDDSGLIHARAEPAGPVAAALDWNGHDNAFVGWPSWLDVGERPTIAVANLAAAREVWKGTDASSRESRRGWPIDDLVSPSAMTSLPDARASILARVAEPQPSLVEATVGAYVLPPVPEAPRRPATGPGMTTGPTPRATAGMPLQAGVNASIDPNAKGRAPLARPKAPTAPVPGPAAGAAVTEGELTFDLADPSWRGDLGLFLARRIAPGASRVVVKVVGGGTWPMTPVRLPDGSSIAIEAANPAGPGPAWVAASGPSAPALLEVRGGDLSLTGVTLAWSPSSRVPRLVRVEDGHLMLSHAVLTSGASAMPAGSGLVLFRAPGTRPLPIRPGPFASPTDRPTCSVADSVLIAAGGEAIGAELGRGLVGLVNTAVIATGEGGAIALRPQKVARSRFEADLALDHCSIAAEGSFVQIGPWPGAGPGPARPWFVSSSRTAFFEVAERGRRGAVLLRSLGDGLAHGALAWQANGDGYDLGHFTASGPGDPPPGRQRPDVKALWVDFWGPRHILNVVGPNPRKGDGASVLTRDRLRPDGLAVEDLRLDPKAHPDLGVDLRLLPPGASRPVGVAY